MSSAATECATLISSFSRGIGVVPLMNWADVMPPDSIKRYAVDTVSNFNSLIFIADLTCSPIILSAFRPLSRERYKSRSALPEICLEEPGKIITGSSVELFSSATEESKSVLFIRLPPMRIPSAPPLVIDLAASDSGPLFTESGSTRTRYADPFSSTDSRSFFQTDTGQLTPPRSSTNLSISSFVLFSVTHISNPLSIP